jgi:lipopolysaccharide/colanic/teichoic acid biosynthesis glycosyltransferase
VPGNKADSLQAPVADDVSICASGNKHDKLQAPATPVCKFDTPKRIFDVVFSLLLLIVLSPLLMLLSLLVWGNLGRPILFVQTRPGKGGRLFRLYKFRTMKTSTELDCAAQTVTSGEVEVSAVASDERRLTRFGRLLRATSLDELPELFNILRGDMSFVGPRPLLVAYLPLYSPGQARRHEGRPGLTGLAQVSGRNALDWEERFALDVAYVDQRSLWLDLKILGRTAAAVLRREGVHAEGSATAEPFTGTQNVVH